MEKNLSLCSVQKALSFHLFFSHSSSYFFYILAFRFFFNKITCIYIYIFYFCFSLIFVCLNVLKCLVVLPFKIFFMWRRLSDLIFFSSVGRKSSVSTHHLYNHTTFYLSWNFFPLSAISLNSICKFQFLFKSALFNPNNIWHIARMFRLLWMEKCHHFISYLFLALSHSLARFWNQIF